MNIQSRRYTGNKYKLMDWIKASLSLYCSDSHSFFDVFAGTGVVTAGCLDMYDEFFINDFLYSNTLIYNAFMGSENINLETLQNVAKQYQELNTAGIEGNYVSENFGDKYFSYNDAKLIGHIRQKISDLLSTGEVNQREHDILLASLMYSFDKISNTVGHYEAYIKGHEIHDRFKFNLISPIRHNKKVHIFREDSNVLCKKIIADIAFIDPPYNSRQYSRFYHVLETITKWDKPELNGVACKPKEENMSNYCRNNAPVIFKDLIDNLQVKYIAVTYNNTYTSKSSSSRNKISLEQIQDILTSRGKLTILSHDYSAFNAGKTDFKNHKEFLFICEVE